MLVGYRRSRRHATNTQSPCVWQQLFQIIFVFADFTILPECILLEKFSAVPMMLTILCGARTRARDERFFHFQSITTPHILLLARHQKNAVVKISLVAVAHLCRQFDTLRHLL
jgi:hypothetical protein